MIAPRHPRSDTLHLPARSQDQASPPLAPTPPSPAHATSAAASEPVPPDPAEVAARKQANLQREREAHAAAVVRHRQQTREVLALLRSRWPALFTAPVPLAVGVTHEIRAGLGEARVGEARVSRMQLGRALRFWTRAPGYLAAVAAGQRRRHLDGTDAGEPDEAQRQHAREILAQRAVRRTR